MINKRWVSLLTAVSMCIPMVTALQTLLPTAPTAEAAAVSSPAPDHEVRVVAKRITGDDTYLEISLEVDRDYEEYTAVGVVLEYDATKLVPAASWDDGAVEADMSANTSWATRRALPTLGKDTWTSHTALAYQTQKVDTTDPSGTAMIPDKGYLYLGAEYPGTIPDPYDPTVTPDPSASPTTAPAAPTAAPTLDPSVTPDPDIYVNPIVVARFMYVGADATAKKATKTAIEGVWTTPAPAPAGTSWDEDWLGKDGMGDYFTVASSAKNEILHIADDAISARSTAEYGAAVYFSDYSRKVFRYEFPTPVPTSTPAPTPAAGATAAPQPFSTYAPAAVGSAVTTAEQMNAGEIEIVLGEGKSAKAGGLTLNDVFMILFFDWDDTIIGSITAVKGGDMRESVEEYVKEKLMHPDLATKDYGTMVQADFLKRTNTYRGKYPHPDAVATEPFGLNGANTVTDGEKYPLSNKLDYVIAGMDLDKDYPRANCWTLVNKENMSDVWTALDYSGTARNLKAHAFEKIDQTTGYAYDSSGNPDPTAKLPTLVSYDFGNIQETDIDDGILYVKAVYRAGILLDKSNKYYTLRDLKYTLSGTTINATVATYSITHTFERINSKGQGVARIRDAKFKAEATVDGMAKTMYLSPQGKDYNHGDYLDIELLTNRYMTIVKHTLVETYGADALSGAQRGTAYTGTTATSSTPAHQYNKAGRAGIMQLCPVGKIRELALAGKQSSINITMIKDAEIMSATGAQMSSITTAQKTALKNMADAAKTNQGTDDPEINYYMIQYAILNSGAYVAPEAAQAACVSKGYSWCS